MHVYAFFFFRMYQNTGNGAVEFCATLQSGSNMIIPNVIPLCPDLPRSPEALTQVTQRGRVWALPRRARYMAVALAL